MALLIVVLLAALLTSCVPASASTSLCGAGDLPLDAVYQEAILGYALVRPSVAISYTALGSERSQCRIMANKSASKCASDDNTAPLTVDFAASDSILEEADYISNPDLQMYPTAATAVVPVYNLKVIANLTLSTAVLAQIFSGQILMWDDPRIVSLNPNFTAWQVPAGQRIEVVVHDSGSGTTGVFRQALCYFDDVFASQVGPGTNTNWTGVNVTYSALPQAYVTVTPYALSYTSYAIAWENALPIPKLKKASGAVVEASQLATTYALQELGLEFGNNGDSASHLTALLTNAQGSKAWPIVAYTYLIMRKSSPKAGATCTAVEETAKFWNWFWASDLATNIVKRNGFTPLPDIIKGAVVSRFVADITCDGKRLLSTTVTGSGTSWVAPVFEKFALFYTLQDPSISVSYSSVPLLTEAAVEAQLNADMFVASHVPWTSASAHAGVKFLIAGVAVVVISQYNITLDLPTLAAILDGNITTWLSPALLQLNGGTLRQSNGAQVTDASQRIVLFNGPTFADPFVADTLRSYVPSFTGAALSAVQYFSSEATLRSAVSATPHSLGISVMVGSFDSNLQFARLKRTDGAVVAPTWQSVQACATADVYNAQTGDYQLAASVGSTCYPLASAVYVTAHKSQCSATADAQRTAAVAFLSWLLPLSSLAGALEGESMAPLTLLPAVNATNQKALDMIACNISTTSTFAEDWPPIVIGVCCGSVVVCFLCFFSAWLWKCTIDTRVLQKQSADDKLAQSCATSFASFDLEALEWLKSLEKPDPIRLSFLQIFHLLAEVRPFIPDQLLASLQHRESESSSEEVRVLPAVENFDCGERTRPSPAGHHGASCDSDAANDETDHNNDQSPKSSCDASVKSHTGADPKRCSSIPSMKGSVVHGKVDQRRKTPKDFPGVPSAVATDCRRKVAVFMYVHYGFASGSVSEQEMPQRVTALLGDLVTIAKAHGATIDHVVYGSLALHWGVAFSSAQGPLRATSAALEMAQLRDHLPDHLQEAMELRVAVVYGNCDVSTASAAGYRFFVVAGKEVQMAMDVVAQDVMSKCKCEVLITQAVYQEVQYMVDCMPRLWFGDVLMWEPQQLRPTNPNRTDEWMYQLRSLEGSEGQSFSAKSFHAVFMMARGGIPPAQVQAEARRLRTTHAAEMTAQDIAALQYLESTMAAEAWSKSGMGVLEVWP